MMRSGKRGRRSALAVWLTAVVIVLQVSILVVFTVDRSDPPASGSLWQGIWALMHRPSFYPLVGLLVVGPPATWMAWSIRGAHRWGLVLGWGVFVPLVTYLYGHRVWVMLKILWEHG